MYCFYDTGLVCYLLGMEKTEQLSLHFLRGELFENFVLAELTKNRYNRGLQSNLWFWRDNKGSEIDCIIETANNLYPIEIKSGKTASPDYFKGLKYWNKISGNSPENAFVIYGGDSEFSTEHGQLMSWRSLGRLFEVGQV